jgi:hypothetical protein
MSIKINRGHFTKTAYVETNDPKLPRFILRLSGEITPFIKVSPSRTRLHGFYSDSLSKMILLEAQDNSLFNILEAKSSLPGFQWTVTPNKDSKKYQFKFQIKSDVPKSVRGKIRIFTDHPHKKSLDIFVSAYFKPEVKLKPARIYWENLKEKPAQYTVYLISKKPNKKIQIKKLFYPEKLFKVSWQKVKAKQAYEIEIVPKTDQFGSGTFNYRLKVITNSALSYPLEIILAGKVKP